MDPGPAFDPLLLSQVRLGIVSVLMTRPEASFVDLKSLLGLTQGNLGIHLRKLEDAGYVTVIKAFVKRKPKTTCQLTAGGRKAFLAHLDILESIAREAASDAS
jgi:DNA-binding MarR family transcriptional regulator